MKDRRSRWPVFVANRCSEILTLLPNAYWHQVRSKENPADAASRGIDPRQILNHSLWWHGPDWLIDEPIPWSTTQAISAAQNPVHSSLSLSFSATDKPGKPRHPDIWDLVYKFSSLTKLLRITAYYFRFISKLAVRIQLRKSSEHSFVNCLEIEFWDSYESPFSSFPTARELENCCLLWIYQCQRSKSSVLKLSPVLKEGLLRVGGRLRHSFLEDESKQPLIKPSAAPLASLVVEHVHALTLHGGMQLTLITLRRQYWLIRGRQILKPALHKFVTYLCYAAASSVQRMGDLPKSRVTPDFSFNRSGVDYAGRACENSSIQNAR